MGNRVDIKKVFEVITKRAEEGIVGDELKNYLEEEFHFSYEHMDRLFLKEYRITINEYAKRKRLQHAYSKWIHEGRPVLSENEVFNDIKKFKSKFRRMFGESPEEAYEKKTDLDVFMPDNEIYRGLSEDRLVSNYQIKGDGVSISIDEQQALLYLMSRPNYLVPQKLWDLTCASNDLDGIEKKQLLLLMSKAYKTSDLRVEYEKNQFDYLVKELDLYDIDAPNVIEGSKVFSPFIKDSQISLFEEMISTIMPGLYIQDYFPTNDSFMWAYARWKGILMQEREAEETIENFAAFCGIDVNDAIASLWKKIRIGFIRYMYNEEKV